MKAEKRIEVEPVSYHWKKNGITVFYYNQIKLHLIIDSTVLGESLNSAAKKGSFKVIEAEENVYYVQYPNTPLMIILDNGRLYTLEHIWNSSIPKWRIRHQASILLQILHKQYLVDNLRRRYFSFKKYGKDIKDDIPEEDTSYIPFIEKEQEVM